MARLIEVENRLFEFPDDTPDEVIKSTIQREFAPPKFGDVVKAGVTGGVSALQRHVGGGLQFLGDVGEKVGIPGAESVTAAGKGIRESADINQELATPENMTYWQKAGSGALSSVIAASPYVIGGLGMGGARAIGAARAGMVPEAAATAGAARAANVGIGAMSAGEGLRKYGEVRDEGFGIGRSLVHGTAEAGAEFIGEKIPVTNALKVLKVKGLLRAVGTFIGQDLVGEQFTTAAEWLNAKLSNRPDTTVAELIEDAKLTFGATLLTGPLQAGVVLPARVAVDKLVNPRIEAAATALPERKPLLPQYGMAIPSEAIGFETQNPLYPDDVIVTNEAVARSKRRMPTARVLTEGGFVPEDLIANPPAEMPVDLKMSRLAALVQKGAFRSAEEQTEMTQLRRTLTEAATLNPDARLLIAESAPLGEQQLTGDIIIGQTWRKRTTQRHNRLKKLVGMEGAQPPSVSTPLVEAPPPVPGESTPTVVENAAAFGVPPERTRMEYLPSQIAEGSFTAGVVARGNWVNPATNQTLINEVDTLQPGVTLYSQSDDPKVQAKITQLHRIAQAWAGKFIPGAKIVLKVNPGLTPDMESGQFSALGPKTFALSFSLGRTNADSFLTLSHEFGHGVAYATLENAPQEEQETLLDAYYTALEQGRAQTFREFAKDWFGPRRYKQLMTWAESSGLAEAPATQVVSILEKALERKGYVGSFDEWFAEQTVRYVYDRKGVVPEARGFFAKVVASLKAFFAKFGDKFAPNQTFADWMDTLAARNAGEVDLQAKEKGDKALRLQLRKLGYTQDVIDSLTDEVTGFDTTAARQLIEETQVPKKFRAESGKIVVPELEMATFRMSEYTTKVIEQLPKKPLIKRRTIEDLLRQASVRDVERERLQTVLAAFSGDMIDRASFAHAVVQDALWLERTQETRYASYGLSNVLDYTSMRPGAAGIVAPRAYERNLAKANYAWSEPTSVVYTTPEISHNYYNHFETPKYFAHLRAIDDYINSTRYVYEIQSDLMQHLTTEVPEGNEESIAKLKRQRDGLNLADNIAFNTTRALEGVSVLSDKAQEIYASAIEQIRVVLDDATQGTALFNGTELVTAARYEAEREIGRPAADQVYRYVLMNLKDLELRIQEDLAALGGSMDAADAKAINRYRKTWFERLVREEVRDAAENGVKKMRVATADTVAKVEGWRRYVAPGEYNITPFDLREFDKGALGDTQIVRVEADHTGIHSLINSSGNRTSPYQVPLNELYKKLPSTFGANQGLYNRYKTEIERFVKQTYGAKEVLYTKEPASSQEQLNRRLREGTLSTSGEAVTSTWLEFDLTPAMATDPVVLYNIPLWSRLAGAAQELGARSGVTSFPEDTVRFNNVVKYGLGAFQMVKLNEHVPGTVAFRDGLRNKMRYKAEWLHQANDVVDEWVYDMPKTEAAKLSRLLLDESRAGDLAKTDAEKAASWFSKRETDADGAYTFKLRPEVIKQYGLSDQAVELYSKIRSMFYDSLDHMERLGVLELVRTYIPMIEARAAAQAAVRNRLKVGEVIMVAEAYAQENPEVHAQLTAALENLHNQFEELRKKPYTPYARFGQWAIRVRAGKEGVWRGKNVSKGDVIYMETFEKKLDMQNELNEIKKEFEGTGVDPVVVPTYIPDVVYAFGGMPPAILDAMKTRLDLSEEQLREFKEILSDLTAANSFAKRMKHRRGVEGYTEDAARAFTDYFMRFANSVSKVQAMPELDDALAQLKDYARRLEEMQNGNAVNAWRLYEWLFQTKEYLKNPGSELSELKSFVSLFYLGANISSATLNAVQVPLVTGPYLSERFGVAATFNALQKAYVDVLRSWKDLGKLTPDEQAMIERGLSDEFLNESFATELAQIAEGGALTRVQPVTFGRRILNKMNHYAMLPFKVIEEANRRVTALATYRLARAEGFDGAFDEDAYAAARAAVEDTQNVYAIENRPVFMRGNKSVIFQFMHYSQNMIFQSLGGDDSWKRLLLAQLVVAGVMGLPFATDLKDIAKFLGRKWFGVDFDVEFEARKFLDDMGVDHTLVMNGLTADVFGFDVSRRVSLGQVIPGMEAMGSHREFNKALLDAVGDVGGAGVAILFNALKFISSEDPSLYKQLQHLAPSAIRNVMKSVDAAEKGGVTSRNNAMLAETEWLHNAGMALGFQPKDVGDAFRVVNVQSEIAAYWIKRREVLLEEWHHVKEARGNDPEGRADVMTRIRKYNSEVPDPKLKIGGDTLARSGKARRKSQRLQERGLGTVRQLKRSAEEVSSVFSDED